ncbi:NAD(P)-dependent alcohol dehydrogenase [Kribbella sancticallisti]|uniref:NAD(P)-dependent alcohol dehydrogenase n=1 Tax=Kribbella sancticallisti TaxID=460087 RepID=A0ABN2D859_9ACTN
MKAIAQYRYGGAETLEVREIERPAPKDDQVLVEVKAAGVDAGVWHLMTGEPYLMRVIGFGLRAPKTAIRGRDLAGRVVEVGAKVTRFQPGDEVFGTAEGTFAEYVAAREDRLTHKPAEVSFEQAAATPISAGTALGAVRGKVKPGTKVLITGAAGGVGTFAVQLAKLYGAEVTGVCSTAKADLVAALGADHVIDHTREDFADGNHQYDVIIDTAGSRDLRHVRKALTPKGRLVIVGGERDGKWFGVGRPLRAALLNLFVGQKIGGMLAKESSAEFEELGALMAEGKIRPAIDRTFQLSEAPDAIRYVQGGKARGKVVVTL